MNKEIKIRPYRAEEFSMINSWWAAHSEIAPTPDMLPHDTTYILELNGTPALCVSIILTNVKQYAFVENFVGNPEIDGEARYRASSALSEYVSIVARQLGYKTLLCFAHQEPLFNRYEELGFAKIISGLSSFGKSLGDVKVCPQQH